MLPSTVDETGRHGNKGDGRRNVRMQMVGKRNKRPRVENDDESNRKPGGKKSMDDIREHCVANTTDNRRVFFGFPLAVRNDISIVNYFRVASVRGREGSENVGRADRRVPTTRYSLFSNKKKMRSKRHLNSRRIRTQTLYIVGDRRSRAPYS